jgi:hypothetical protein
MAMSKRCLRNFCVFMGFLGGQLTVKEALVKTGFIGLHGAWLTGLTASTQCLCTQEHQGDLADLPISSLR